MDHRKQFSLHASAKRCARIYSPARRSSISQFLNSADSAWLYVTSNTHRTTYARFARYFAGLYKGTVNKLFIIDGISVRTVRGISPRFTQAVHGWYSPLHCELHHAPPKYAVLPSKRSRHQLTSHTIMLCEFCRDSNIIISVKKYF